MKLKSLIVSCMIVCSCSEGQPGEWKTFVTPGLPNFSYPPFLRALPESKDVEETRTFKFASEAEAIRVEVSGFFHIPEAEKRSEESNAQYVLRSLRERVGRRLLEERKDSQFVRVLAKDGDKFTVYLYFLPTEESNGGAIKSITLVFPSKKREVTDAIEKSWAEGAKKMEY